MLLFIGSTFSTWAGTKLGFNTSHVTLYQQRSGRHYYILRVSIHLMLLFIYVTTEYCTFQTSFNTSHVTLYHICQILMCFHNHRFNTSHVTLYLRASTLQEGCIWVSIHLMLLFITISWPSSYK